MKWIHVCALVLILSSLQSAAQQFGAFPPGTKWKQIDTDTVRIIFSSGAEAQAARIATLIHKAAADTPYALGNSLKKVNIVLHNRTTTANGYVGLAPFRSEFYLVPGSNVFDFGNLPWHENLAIHEYRHVQQYNNFRNGLSRGFYFLFGEQGLAFANAITVPDWFFEGDAVHSETALTPQGRGRQPYFLSGYNSLWLEQRKYSWLKLRNGSLKDYVPNHYQLGYLLVNYGYEKYGPDFWKKVTRDASAFKGLFYPFQKAVRKYSGSRYRSFRKEAIDSYQQNLKYNARKKQPEKTVTDYFFPQVIGHDSLLYQKTAYNRIPAFYIRDQQGEHKISLRNISSEEWFGYRNGRIVYTAFSTDPRWDLVNYSDIVVLDIQIQKEKRITEQSKYFTPDFSPSGDKIVAVRINDSLETELQILNSANGNISKSFKAPGAYFTNPRFIDEENIIVGVRTPQTKMSLQKLNLASGVWESLTPESYSSISVPYVYRDTVYFTASFFGNDDLYALALTNKKLFQLTRRYTGTYFPSASADSIVFSFFTSNGLQLESMAKKDALWAGVNVDSLSLVRGNYRVALENNILGTPTERFATKRYNKSTGLFNFHSWAPNYNDPEFTFSLYGDNILNTFSNELYYRYNSNENSHGVGWNAAYGGLFPVLSAGTEYTFSRHIALPGNTLVTDQFEARVGYNIPLNFTKGKTYRFFNVGSNYVFNYSLPKGIFKDSLKSGSVSYLHHFISWSQYRPRAIQHIFPKLGYTISVNHRHYLSSKGSQFLSGGQLFLPSFGNHSIVLTGSIQETKADTNSVVFANRFANSRGYSDRYFIRMWKLSGNYHLPVAYPDFGFASIIYLQRLRANLFYDFTRVYAFNKTRLADLRSVGTEIYFDTKWWNQLPVSFGIRWSHLLDNGFSVQDRKGNNRFELILPINLIPN